MSLQAILFNLGASRSDKKRDSAIALPAGVTECRNISYGPYGKDSLLDVYYPAGTTQSLPTIVSIHGGGYVYGSKEIYRRFGMDMARRGFAFVNFNYRLAPKHRFPTPLADTNAVLEWVSKNHLRYHLDPNRIILIGDSAGAQLASHYAAIFTNPEFAKHFDLELPQIKICALGLYCGIYDAVEQAEGPRKGLSLDYLGKEIRSTDPRLQVLSSITPSYPPAFICTAQHDFLREKAQPMCDHLTALGIDAVCRCYGTEEATHVGHVFHVNIILPEAVQCNDDAAAFYRKYL